ncbi:MAG: exosome complex exonuclease Rrp41, partial [Methanothrix sp.]|nr:exosome complex exonuclease Rrp41 [Methanothrix sp.]
MCIRDRDNFGQADLPIAMTPEGEITLMQMDGRLNARELQQAVEMAMKGAREIYEIQRRALVERYSQLETPPEEVRACD